MTRILKNRRSGAKALGCPGAQMLMRLSVSCFLFLLPAISWAQEIQLERVIGEGPGLAPAGVSKPLLFLLVLMAIVMIPIIAMMTTAFVKLTVVLSMVRNALGTQQIPPTPIVTGLALILTVYIMSPIGIQMYEAAQSEINKTTDQPLLSQASMDILIEGFKKAKEPMRDFMIKHVHPQEQKLFYTLGQVMMKEKASLEEAQEGDVEAEGGTSPPVKGGIQPTDFMVLVPAFVISELVEAFQISFIIFLPFLVIDVVVTNVLLALGMFMVPPTTIALPFKLLLFVIVDGWHILSRALLMGYM